MNKFLYLFFLLYINSYGFDDDFLKLQNQISISKQNNFNNFKLYDKYYFLDKKDIYKNLNKNNCITNNNIKTCFYFYGVENSTKFLTKIKIIENINKKSYLIENLIKNKNLYIVYVKNNIFYIKKILNKEKILKILKNKHKIALILGNEHTIEGELLKINDYNKKIILYFNGKTNTITGVITLNSKYYHILDKHIKLINKFKINKRY